MRCGSNKVDTTKSIANRRNVDRSSRRNFRIARTLSFGLDETALLFISDSLCQTVSGTLAPYRWIRNYLLSDDVESLLRQGATVLRLPSIRGPSTVLSLAVNFSTSTRIPSSCDSLAHLINGREIYNKVA